MTRLKDWAQLVRVPNTLTASADGLAGFSLAAGVWQASHAPALIMISLASIALYWAGMVLNDVNDLEQDRLQKRKGPLVDNRIGWATALRFGWGLIVAGVLLALLAGYLAHRSRLKGPLAELEDAQFGTLVGAPLTPFLWLAPGGVAVILALLVVAYDSPLKRTPFASWIMGACRAVNLTMGIALGIAASVSPADAFERMGNAMYWVPIGHGLFVVGLTMAARKESMLQQQGWQLARGWGISVLGIALVAASAFQAGPGALHYLTPEQGFPLLVLLLALPWFNRALQSIQFKSVPMLVRAIKQAIVTILFLDAAIALQFAGSFPGIFVCSLIVPTFLLGRWFRMT